MRGRIFSKPNEITFQKFPDQRLNFKGKKPDKETVILRLIRSTIFPNPRSDQTLQDLVYKLVPGLFTSE